MLYDAAKVSVKRAYYWMRRKKNGLDKVSDQVVDSQRSLLDQIPARKYFIQLDVNIEVLCSFHSFGRFFVFLKRAYFQLL